MAKAKVTHKKVLQLYVMKDYHHGCNLLLGREASRLDPARNGHDTGVGSDASRFISGKRQLQPSATNTTDLLPHSTGATFTATSNSKINRSGVIKGTQPNDVLFHNGRRTMSTDLEHTPRKPKIDYRPAPGLITLFSRTCTCRRNPNPQQRPTSPPNLSLLDHRSYVEVVQEGMEGNGKFGHGSGPRGIGSAGFHGQAQGQAYARQGYQRPYQWYGPVGFQGNRGGGRHYDQCGRGFGGSFRQAEF
jgi:hypothetical protein